MGLTGYEETSVVEVGAVLDASPATAEEVYLRTMAYSERAIAAVAAKRAGGSTPAFRGAVLVLSTDASTYASGNAIPFDTASFDSDGFADLADNKLVVPTGLTGWYRIGLILNVSNFDLAAQTLQVMRIDTSGNPDNMLGVFVPFESTGGDGLVTGVMGPLAEGDDLVAKLFWNGGGTADILHIGSQLTCEYLGPNA